MATAVIPDLVQSFLDEAWEALTTFQNAEQMLRTHKHEQLAFMSHRLRGSAGIYGFSQTSRLAGLMERIFEGAPHFTDPQREKVIEFAGQATAVLSETLDRIAIEGREGSIGLELGRLGAPELIVELAFANPTAFTPKAAPAEEGLTETPATKTEHSDIVDALESYYQENSEYWEFFAPETVENLEAAHLSLDGIKAGDEDGSHLKALFRAMHTIKGAAYSVGCKPIGAFAHKLEDVMVAVREGNHSWDSDKEKLLFDGISTINTMMEIAEGKASNQKGSLAQDVFDVETRIALTLGLEAPQEIQKVVESTSLTSAPTAAETVAKVPVDRGSIRVGIDRLDSLLNLAGETLTTRSRLDLLAQRFQDLDEVLEAARLRLAKTTSDFETKYLNPRLSLDSSKAEAESTTTLGKTVGELFSELEFDRYDDLNILSRSITEMTSDMSEVRAELGDRIRELRQENETFTTLSERLRSEVSRARLVPMGRFFTRLNRQVKQLIGKRNIEVEFYGENVEIDSVVLDGLSEALIHLVNNAVIHGLENDEARGLTGKSPEGHLTVRATQARNFLVLQVQDDGRGIDVEGVKTKAVAKGLRTQEQIDRLTPQEAIDLIFLAGLSTAESVTTEAGRGVGMDAVSNTVRRLRGELSVETAPGVGSTFTVRVPQSMVVNEILMLEASGEVFAFPREFILTLVNATKEEVVDGVYFYGEERVPVHNLSKLLGLPETPTSDYSLAIIEGREGLSAIAADRFIGLDLALVKPLSEPVSTLPHVAGATILANGDIILALNPLGLLSMGNVSSTTRVFQKAKATQTPLLLVDDSLSVRRVVSQMLRREGFQVVTASDGQEALELLENQEFQMVITDLEMPRMSGFELLEEARRRPQLSSIPIAVLTTRASSKHRDLAVSLGANAYMTKPLDEVELHRFLSENRVR